MAPHDGDPSSAVADLPPAERRNSLLRLAILASALLVGLLMHADAETATLFGVEGPRCPLRKALGEQACPGCGLTRATVLALHGELSSSWRVHPAGILLVLACVGGIVVHLDILWKRRKRAGHETILRVGGRTLAAGLVVAGLLRWLL
jgi:hypothetical protein